MVMTSPAILPDNVLAGERRRRRRRVCPSSVQSRLAAFPAVAGQAALGDHDGELAVAQGDHLCADFDLCRRPSHVPSPTYSP